jgi:hypothetical protein
MLTHLEKKNRSTVNIYFCDYVTLETKSNVTWQITFAREGGEGEGEGESKKKMPDWQSLCISVLGVSLFSGRCHTMHAPLFTNMISVRFNGL